MGQFDMKTALIILGVTAVILFVGWLGLRWQPAPFAPYPQAGVMETVPLPADLPAPVERFYRQVYGDEMPLIETAVITGRGWIRPVGNLTFPARFRFTHQAGQNYRHYMEATFFGLPILKVNEHFLDGRGRLELPFGVVENEPKVDQGGQPGSMSRVGLAAISLCDRSPRSLAGGRWEYGRSLRSLCR
jgi:hypothetical protein